MLLCARLPSYQAEGRIQYLVLIHASPTLFYRGAHPTNIFGTRRSVPGPSLALALAVERHTLTIYCTKQAAAKDDSRDKQTASTDFINDSIKQLSVQHHVEQAEGLGNKHQHLARGAVFPLGGLLSPLRIKSGKADPFLSAFALAGRHHLRSRTEGISTDTSVNAQI